MGTCKFYVSVTQPECGVEAVTAVPTRTGPVELCAKHKAIHDENNARRRMARKAG